MTAPRAGRVAAAADRPAGEGAPAVRAAADGSSRRAVPWSERWSDWRARTVARPGFQRWAAAFWPTRGLARRHARELFDLMAGFVYSQVLLACVRLELFTQLAAGPLPLARLAERTGLPGDALRRLLAAAASLELVELRRGDRVALGRLGAPLAGQPGLLAMVEHHATLYADIADPLALLRGVGRPPAMAGYWPYAAAAEEPAGSDAAPARLGAERVADYSALMSASQPLVAQEVLDAWRFDRHRVLLDVGGGDGTFLRAAAARAPALRLQLFDLPAVVDCARPRMAQAGLEARTALHGGDFFRDPLPTGADLVTLVRVCFDHPDERVLALLRNVRRALPHGGTLLLAEPMSGVAGAEAMGDAYFGFYLLAMGRGRPRSAAQLAALLVQAGFDAPRSLRTRMPLQAGVLAATCGSLEPGVRDE